MKQNRKREVDKIDPTQLDFLSAQDGSQFLENAALEARYSSFEIMNADHGPNGATHETTIRPLIDTEKALKRLKRNLKKQGDRGLWGVGHLK